jgi:hypothetical protein
MFLPKFSGGEGITTDQQQVTDLYEKSAGKWQALVMGTEDYVVNIQLAGDTVQKATCTCPYDAGICKHIVAALLALQEEPITGAEEPAPAKSRSKKGGGKKAADAKAALQNLSREELLSLVQQYAAQSREFKNFLAIHLLSKSNPGGKESYRQILQQAIKPYKRRGFIEYNDSFKAMKFFTELADEAEAQWQKGFYREAADISLVLIEEIAEIIEYMDDSAGFVTDISNAAFNTLHGVAESEAPFSLKEELFTYILQERKKKKYGGWDWPDDFFRLAIATATSEPQYRQLLAEADTELEKARNSKDAWTKDYTTQNWLNQKRTVLQKMGKPAEAQSILLQHLDIPDFRSQVVQDHLQHGRLEEAAALCEEALQKGIGHQRLWCEFLLQIAQRRHDTESIRKWTLNLFLKTDFSPDYFRLYKATFPEAEWPGQRDRLLAVVRQSMGPYFYPYTLAPLYVEEQLWQDLLQAFRLYPDLEFLQQFDKHLLPQFGAEVLDAYEKALRKYAAEKQGREHYVRIRKILAYLQTLKGGDELSATLVQQFRSQYKQRRAMMEELDKLVL